MTTEVNAPAPAPAATPAAPAPAPAAPAPAPLDIGNAPAPAPVASAAPAPAAPAPAPAESKPEAVIYNPTGDAGLDMVLKFVGDLGYSPENPAMKAAMEGDFSMLEAELATKGVKGYEAHIKLGQQAFTRTREATEAKQKADREAIEKAAGGADNWRVVQAWAAANAEPAEKAEIGKLLSAGGLQAQIAAEWLSNAHAKATNVPVKDGAGLPVATAKGTVNAASTAPLDAREYAAEVMKARIAHKGHGFEDSPAYRQLQVRRMAHRG